MTHYVLNKRNRSLRQLMFEESFFYGLSTLFTNFTYLQLTRIVLIYYVDIYNINV